MEYDVIVIGGGMVGASLARALSGCGLKIAVLESWPLDSKRQPSYDDRAIALAYGSRLILEDMGLWSPLALRVAPIRDIHVSDRGQFGFTRLNHVAQQVEAFGYVVTAHDLGAVLLKDIRSHDDVVLYCPARMISFQIDDAGVRVQVSIDGQTRTLAGKLIVAADGAQSAVRKNLGIGAREWHYGQAAIVANLTPGIGFQGATAFERFTDTGPIAMLPLPDKRYGMIWTVDQRYLDEIVSLNDQAFLERVQRRFGFRLGRFQQAGRRANYPLYLMLAQDIVRHRAVLIGNAAHAVHPITGQGFNLGIRDVAVLAEVLRSAHRSGTDVGDIGILRKYANRRKKDQQTVALVTDGLVRLFTNPLWPIELGRNIGMLALDAIPLGKYLLARQFMGFGGHLPKPSGECFE